MKKTSNGRGTAEEAARYAFLHELPCIVTGREGVEVAHIRYADSWFTKDITGMGQKPHWLWTLPLCPDFHRSQHEVNERDWWGAMGFNPDSIAQSPLTACLALEGLRAIGDIQKAREWVKRRRL